MSALSIAAVFRLSSRIQITLRYSYNSKTPRDTGAPSLPHSDHKSQCTSGTSATGSPSSSSSASAPAWAESEAEPSSWSGNPIVQLLSGQKKQHLALATLAYLTLVNGRKDGGAGTAITTRAEALMDALTHRSQLVLQHVHVAGQGQGHEDN